MVGGVKPEHEQLLAEGHGGEELSKALLSPTGDKINGDGRRGVEDEGHVDGGVLEVSEIGARDGAIGVEPVVPEKLCGHVGGAAYHD